MARTRPGQDSVHTTLPQSQHSRTLADSTPLHSTSADQLCPPSTQTRPSRQPSTHSPPPASPRPTPPQRPPERQSEPCPLQRVHTLRALFHPLAGPAAVSASLSHAHANCATSSPTLSNTPSRDPLCTPAPRARLCHTSSPVTVTQSTSRTPLTHIHVRFRWAEPGGGICQRLRGRPRTARHDSPSPRHALHTQYLCDNELIFESTGHDTHCCLPVLRPSPCE